MKYISTKSGYTLVELMITISIIGLLTGIIVTGLTGSKVKSRDARRVSDLNQIQLALEQYFDRCGQYPTALLPDTKNGCPSTIQLSSYISVVPKDPSANPYGYLVNNGTNPTDFILYTTLESTNAVQQNSFNNDARPSWASAISCYDGNTTNKNYCLSTK